MFRRTLIVVALLGLAAVSAGAAEDRTADAQVVAVVDGAEIRLSEVLAARQSLPERFQALPLETVFPMLVNGLVDGKLAAAEARRLGLDREPGHRKHLARIEEQLLERAFLTRAIEERLTDEALRERYRRKVETSDGKEQVRASHIILDTEDQARQVIAELEAGTDFAEVARRRSTGPSADQGGDLGYFAREEMVPAFAEAAFALAIGEVTRTPVRTRFGWHVIRVSGRRTNEVPDFEQAKADLRAELAREIGATVIQELRRRADIRRFAPDDTAAGAAKE